MKTNPIIRKLADKYWAEQCARLGPINHATNEPAKVTRKVSRTRNKKG